MNIILCYNDINRFFTPGSYVLKELSNQNEIFINAHCRIPEDTGICRESSNPDTDLILIVDDGTHFKMHHERGFLPKKCKVAFWISDLHRSDWSVHRLQMIREFKFDHVFYAQKNFRQKILDCNYQQHECSWLPHATDADIFKPMPWIDKKYDIGFVGYLNSKREQTINVLKEYVNFKHFASVWSWQACHNMNELKIGLNVPVEDDVLNMRCFETMSVGIPLLTSRVVGNGMEDFFEEDKDYLAFSDDQELKEKAVRLLASPDLRKTIADSARNKVLAMHTYRNRINSLLATMGFNMLK